jgi:hypothetical protein
MSPATSPSDVPSRRPRQQGIRLDCGKNRTVRHVGIVFVHGIGSQDAGETLLDWGGAIVRVLLDARIRNHCSADPVISVELDPGPSEIRFIEVGLPEVRTAEGSPAPEQHWVMTEAWCAERVRALTFGQMADWLGSGGAISRIVDTLMSRNRGAEDPRLRPAAAARPLARGAGGVQEASGPAFRSSDRGSRMSSLWRGAGALGGNLYLRGASALLLLLYALLRAIEKVVPVGPLKGGGLTRPLDNFVPEWFNDVHVLLGDPVQTASIRGHLADAIRDLDLAGCDRIVVVAHSGGAIVSYVTLSDATRRLRVDRLITLGESLNLAWYLMKARPTEQGSVEDELLGRNVFETQPELEWDDFWASQDPAPAGVLSFAACRPPDDRSLGRISSHAVWNRLSGSQDNGGYWDNDEEFLIPLMRLLEHEGRGPADTQRPSLFGDAAADVAWSNERRRRLSLLSLMRQSCMVAPIAGIIAAFAIGSQTLFHLADAIAAAWDKIPYTSIASGVVDSVRELRPEDIAPMRFLAEAGVWVVALTIVGAAAFSLLATPLRPLPWRQRGRWPGTVWLTLKAAPYLAGLPALGVIALGAWRFLSTSTVVARDVGSQILAGAAIMAVLAVGFGLLAGARTVKATGLGYAVNVVLMAVFMVLVVSLVVAPVFAAILYVDLGREVVGGAAIILAFQVVGRIASWRWEAWDARGRAAARTGIPYRGPGRVLAQTLLLAVVVFGLLVAVAVDSVAAAAVAGVALVLLVLAGLAIDILDAVRAEMVGLEIA